jgi:NTP pyrophosphatase (non-canonical NTP hydrolase)
MSPSEYQCEVESFDCHPIEDRFFAHALGLAEEAGEFCGKLCKAHRAGVGPLRTDMLYELGDVLWRVAALCNGMDATLEEVMQLNIAKLTSRKERGVIIGEGDDR